MQHIKEYINRIGKEQLLYYTAFLLIVISAFLRTTMFPVNPQILNNTEYAGCLIMLIKIALFQSKNLRLFLTAVGIIGAAALSGYLSGSYMMLFSLAMITVGAVNIPFKKIAGEFFWITSATLAVTIICSLTGAIENLQYTFEAGRGVRNSFGIVYPTDFAAHVLFTMLSGMAAYEEKLNIFHSAIGIVIAAIVYYFCNTRVDCVCMILACVGVPLIKALRKKSIPAALKKISAVICTFSMPLAAALMIFLTAVYTSDSPLLARLNQIINGRLALGREGFDRYPVTPLGQRVTLVGAGRSTAIQENYFYLDCSYMYCLLKFGVIITILLIAAYVLIGRRYRRNGIMLWLISIIALNCMIAHHLPDVAYIIFTAALFATDEPAQPQPTIISPPQE